MSFIGSPESFHEDASEFARDSYSTMEMKRLGFVTYRKLPDLTPDDRLMIDPLEVPKKSSAHVATLVTLHEDGNFGVNPLPANGRWQKSLHILRKGRSASGTLSVRLHAVAV